MLTLIGITCVAWTAYEVRRISSSVSNVGRGSMPSKAAAPRYRRFAAWDDRGRPIRVEDMGRA